jgi:hypothetical protein
MKEKGNSFQRAHGPHVARRYQDADARWEIRYNEKKQREEWYFVDMTLAAGQESGNLTF